MKQLLGFFRLLLILGVVATLLGLALNILIDNPYSYRLAQNAINTFLAERFGLNLKFQAVKISVVPLELNLFGVELEVPLESGKTHTLAKSAQIRMGIGAKAIALGSSNPGTLELIDLELNAPFPNEVMQKLSGPKKDDPNETNTFIWPIDVEEFPFDLVVIKNARMQLNIEADRKIKQDSVSLGIENLNLRIDLTDMSDIAVRMRLGTVDFSYDEMVIFDESKLEGKFVIQPSGIRKFPLTVSSADAQIKLDTEVKFEKRNPKNPKLVHGIDLKATGGGDLQYSYLGKLLDIQGTEGQAKIDAHVKLNIDLDKNSKQISPIFLTTLNVKSEKAKLDGFDIAETSAKIDIDLDKLTFTEGILRTGTEKQGDFTGTLSFNKETDFDFTSNITNIRLSELLKKLKVDFSILDSRVGAKDLKIVGKGSPFSMKVSAMSTFREMEFDATKQWTDQPSKDLIGCIGPLRLEIDSQKLAPNSTSLNCFLERAPRKNLALDLNTAMNFPLDAGSKTQLGIGGIIYFADREGLDLRLTSPLFQLSLINGLTPLLIQGHSPLNLRIFGPHSDVKIATALNANQVAINSLQLGKVDANLEVVGDKVLWKDLKILTASAGSVNSRKGHLTFSLNLNTEFNAVQLDKEFCAAFTELITGQQYFFDIDLAKGSFDGPLQQPLAANMQIEADIESFGYGENIYFDSLSGTIKGTNSAIEAANLKIRVRDLNINGSAQISRTPNKSRPIQSPWSSNSQLNLLSNLGLPIGSPLKSNLNLVHTDSTKVQFDHLQVLPIVNTYASQAQLGGQLSGTIQSQGSLLDPTIDYDLRLSSAKFIKSSVSNIRSSGQFRNHQLKTEIAQSGKALVAKMQIDFSKPGYMYDWNIYAKRLDVRSLLSKYFAADARNYAYLTGVWTMQGSLANWWQSTGNLKVDEIRARLTNENQGEIKHVDFELDEIWQLGINSNRWSSPTPLRIKSESLELEINTANNRLPEKLMIDIKANADLAALRSLIPGAEAASGDVIVQGSITGSIDKPKTEYRLTTSQTKGKSASIGLATIRPAFTDIDADLRYSNGKIYIQTLRANKGKGTVSVSGVYNVFPTTSLQDNARLDINLNQATFYSQVPLLKTFEADLSGMVSVSGNDFPRSIAGDIKVARARSTRNFDLREEILNALRSSGYGAGSSGRQQRKDQIPLFALDLRINADKSISIANRNVRVVLSSGINVTGSELNPVVLGQIEINDGTFAYKYRRDFRITQGVITFDDPVRPDPRIDILSVSETSGYRIYLAVTGRASDARVDLSIDPPAREDGTPLSKVDILVLLSTGSLPERRRSDIASQDAAKAEALNLLVGAFEEPVEKFFDMSGQTVVQQIYIDSYAGRNGRPTARLNMPLNLHKDWDVIFRADDSVQKVSVGYNVDENVSVSGSIDRQVKEESSSANSGSTDPTDTGVDLKFRFSFP